MKHILLKQFGVIFLTLAVIVLLLACMNRADALAGTGTYDYFMSKGSIVVPTVLANTEIKYTQEQIDEIYAQERAKEVPKEKVKEPEEKKQEAPKEIKPDTPEDILRRERLVICTEAYGFFKEQVVNHTKVVERCATMMTLQYNFESGHGKSKKCVNQNNCYGIKSNSRERCLKSGNSFCAYATKEDGSRDFATMFMKHYEGYKSVRAYLGVYSPDGNGAYPHYVLSHYDKTLKYFVTMNK